MNSMILKEVNIMKIKIADKTLCREVNTFSFKEKIELARQLNNMDVDIIELPQIENVKADTLLVKTVSSFVKKNIVSVATGITLEGIENSVAALSNTENPRLRIEVPASTVGMEYTCHKKAPQMIELLGKLVSYAKEKIDDIEFCAIDATRAESDVLDDLISVALANGATAVTLCDNASELLPDAFADFINSVVSKIDTTKVEVGVACDNKNGLAAANAVMALKSGAQTIKTDADGNNVPLMTMGAIMKNSGEFNGFESGIKFTEFNRTYNQILWIIGNSKNQKTGVTVSNTDDEFVSFSSTDDKETVTAAVIKLGYDLTEEDYSKVYEEFQRVTEKKNITSKELEAIIASVALQVPTTYKLVSYLINNGNIISATAQITLEKDGESMQGVSIGDGPIDAAFLAIEQIIGHRYELDDFQIQSVTEGTEAMGSAIVKLRSGGKLYSGNGISTDIIGAAIKAYIAAVNKIVYEEA